jgi:hypothetical protein
MDKQTRIIKLLKDITYWEKLLDYNWIKETGIPHWCTNARQQVQTRLSNAREQLEQLSK